MILGDIVSQVCSKIRESDSDTQSLVRGWAKLRYELVYGAALWRDALWLLARDIVADQTELIFPAQFERVVAAMMGNRGLVPTDEAFLFATDPEIFERSGNPLRFIEPASIATFVLPAGERMQLVSDNGGDTTNVVSIRGEHEGEEFAESVTLNGTSAVLTENSYTYPLVLAKSATAGKVTVTGEISAETLLVLRPAETERRHARMRLLETPQETGTVTTLLKRRCNPLVIDSDAIVLRGVGQAVLTFTLGDAWAWKRHQSKADKLYAEALALLEDAKHREAWQQASQRQFVPGDSLGDFDTTAWSGY